MDGVILLRRGETGGSTRATRIVLLTGLLHSPSVTTAAADGRPPYRTAPLLPDLLGLTVGGGGGLCHNVEATAHQAEGSRSPPQDLG